MDSKHTHLTGPRIDPPPITGHEPAADLVERTFLAYNAARLRGAAQLLTQRMLAGDVTVLAVTGTVAPDCTVAFEARRYSVPFAHLGRAVTIYARSRVVQVWADGHVIAEHPRHGRERIVIDPRPGVGKTHLAVALGMRAVELGFGVVFYRLEDLLTALKRDKRRSADAAAAQQEVPIHLAGHHQRSRLRAG